MLVTKSSGTILNSRFMAGPLGWRAGIARNSTLQKQVSPISKLLSVKVCKKRQKNLKLRVARFIQKRRELLIRENYSDLLSRLLRLSAKSKGLDDCLLSVVKSRFSLIR